MKLSLAFVIALIILAGLAGLFILSPDPSVAKTGREIRKSAEPSPRDPSSVVNPSRDTPPSLKVVGKTPYDEILHILQTEYADPSVLDSKKPTQAAILGLLNSLDGSAQILSEPPAISSSESKPPAIQTVSALDSFIGYIRLNGIENDTVKQLHEAILKLTQEDHVTGMILDLRFGRGSQYGAAASVASLFLPESRPLFSIRRGKDVQVYRSEITMPPAKLPLMVLVNKETKGALETLAAILKDQKRALVIGNSETAGQAFETSDIHLSSGQILHLATGKILLAQGGDLFLKKISPDVKVAFDEKTEKEILDKPFQPPEIRAETHLFSEAILTGRETAPPLKKEKGKEEASEPLSNGDLVLLHAIDLLKSIHALGLRSTGPSTEEALP